MAYAKGNCIPLSSIWDMVLIGEGSFGQVYRATWVTIDDYGYEFGQTVAIKSFMGGSKRKVLNERDRMANLNHENVIRLLGIVQRGNNLPWLVMEYMPEGDLLSYIHQQRHRGGIRKDGMMKIALGIASGMEYLHYQGIIHGDLAARNCLIASANFDIKICDLGFEDGTNSDCYYNDGSGYSTVTVFNSFIREEKGCPTRWMPPENLPFRLSRNGNLISTNFKCTFDGDIWAFGVVLFEIWSRGEIPFVQFGNAEVCQQLLQNRTPTDFCHITMRRHMWNLMHRCWEYNQEERPGFCEIAQYLQ